MTIRFILRGTVREEASGLGLPGLFVKAYDKDLVYDDLLGTAVTSTGGAFEIVTESGDFADFFERRPDLYLRVYAGDRETLLMSTERGVRWNAGQYEDFDVLVPRESLGEAAPERGLRIVADDGTDRTEIAVGESLVVNATGLRPATVHQVEVTDDEGPLFTDSVISDANGVIRPTVVWPLLGLEDPRSTEPATVDGALEKWIGRTVLVRLSDGEQVIGESRLSIPREAPPLAVHISAAGQLLNGFEVGDHPVTVHIGNLEGWEAARVFMVRRQHAWAAGDALTPVSLTTGRPAVSDVTIDEKRAVRVVLAEPDEVAPGAYDFVVRRVRYGYEDDDDMTLRADDLVAGRHVTGLVVREPFMASKIIRGGCANIQPIAGRYLGIWPYMEYTDVFQVGEDIYGALDPAALDPTLISKMVAIYVVPHKTSAEWTADSSLDHLPVLGGNAATQRWLTQSWCVNANLRLLWPNAQQAGEYDIVADFGNNTGSPAAFVPDNSYDMPLDIIDGYITPGFRVVPDPTTDTSFAFAGSLNYDETTTGTLNVPDDDGSSWAAIPLRATVFFPADAAGVTTPAQISAAQASYPLVVVVHGNSSHPDSYRGYDYLLEHLARNGFIAASIHCEPGMMATGRARILRRHLQLLFASFGGRAANNVGIMGHSRGGEAVTAAARLNHNEGWGYNINAVIALAPSDWILHESFIAPWSVPFHVLYGSLDGDIAGIEETGFSMYDRASGSVKSMAFVYGACHDRFNTIWGDGDFNFGQLGPADQARVIPADTHQKIAKGYMAAFFRQHLRGEAQWRGIFTGDWVPAAPRAATPGLRIYTQYEDTAVRTVDSFEGPHSSSSWATSTIGGAVTETGLPATPQENELATLDTQSPHQTGGLLLRWDGTTDSLDYTVPPGERDVRAYAVLAFRIAQRVDSASNPMGQAQDLRVTLTDGAGISRAIRVSKLAEVPYPDVREYNSYTKSAMCTVRIPISAYTIRCLNVPEVNVADVVSVRFEFAEKLTGEIEIDSLQFTN